MIFAAYLTCAIVFVIRSNNIDSWDKDIQDESATAESVKNSGYDFYPLMPERCKEVQNPKVYALLIEKYTREFCSEGEQYPCSAVGTGWSIAFGVNSVVLLLMSLNYVIYFLGIFFFYARLAASCMNCCMTLANMSGLVIVIVYRFSKLGEIASQCIDGSKYMGKDEELDGGNTFRSDAQSLSYVAVFQLLTFLPVCCIGSLPLRNGRN